MAALMASVLVASLLGSLHCAGMCGPLMAVAVGMGEARPTAWWKHHLAYHGGRLLIYLAFGVLAGAIGASLDIGGRLLGVQRAAAVTAGTFMVLIGGLGLLRHLGARLPAVQLPAALQYVVTRAHRTAMGLSPVPRSALIGLCSGLLPCGWLHAFTITAMGTADPRWGALVMATFWLGTVPVLIGLGVSVQAMAGSIGRRIPLLMSALVVVIGLYTVAGRMSVHLDLPSASRVSTESAVERVDGLRAAEAPCCKTHGH